MEVVVTPALAALSPGLLATPGTAAAPRWSATATPQQAIAQVALGHPLVPAPPASSAIQGPCAVRLHRGLNRAAAPRKAGIGPGLNATPGHDPAPGPPDAPGRPALADRMFHRAP